MQNIGERIVTLRELFRFTQAQLASELRVSDKVISKWERGKSMPNVEDIAGLAKFFGVTSDYLIIGAISKQDEIILSRHPTEQELLSDAKAAWIKKCNAIMKEHGLYRYKDKIFPTAERNDYLNCEEAERYLDIGIFCQVREGENEPFLLGVNIKKLLSFDDYDLFEKIVETGLSFYTKYQRRQFYQHDELISDEDINGLTDTRFYSLLSNQEKLICRSLEYEGYTVQQFKENNGLKDEDSINSCYEEYYQEILNCALKNLKKSNPNYWEIVKVLIEQGAKVQKLVGIVTGGYGSVERYIYADDIFVTDLLYDQVLLKLKQ